MNPFKEYIDTLECAHMGNEFEKFQEAFNNHERVIILGNAQLSYDRIFSAKDKQFKASSQSWNSRTWSWHLVNHSYFLSSLLLMYRPSVKKLCFYLCLIFAGLLIVLCIHSGVLSSTQEE